VTPSGQAPSPPSPLWTAAAVARRLGVAPATLRSWSLRYGIGPLDHFPGRHRRYSDADVAELETLRGLVGQGVVFPAAAAIVRSRRLGAAADDQVGPQEPISATRTPARGPAPATVDDLVLAAHRLDPVAATRIIAASLTRRGVVPTWDHLCRPALAELDIALGCVPAGATLLLSWAVSTCLRRLPVEPGTRDGRGVLLACSAGEQHTLAMEVLFAALAERGVPAQMLGSAVPTSALVHAAEQLRPDAVVVWSQRTATARPTALRRLTAHAGAVVAAGPGWHDLELPPAVTTTTSLAAAVDLTCATPGANRAQMPGEPAQR
jgi:MerR family transcriptional regulator, light-induced transcriptional regulator